MLLNIRPNPPRIRVEVVTPDLQHVQIRVQDNGIGIPSSELKRVFKRFYRVLSPGATQVKGSGLGSLSSAPLFKRHGGRLWPRASGAGKGTTVTIELPRYQYDRHDRKYPACGRRRASRSRTEVQP